jgi:molecular chaperone HscB
MPCRDQPQFELDLRDLERRYKALQIRLHPDKFATASSLEQEYAQQQAAAINQAYDVLKRPLRRAHYIVSGAFARKQCVQLRMFGRGWELHL